MLFCHQCLQLQGAFQQDNWETIIVRAVLGELAVVDLVCFRQGWQATTVTIFGPPCLAWVKSSSKCFLTGHAHLCTPPSLPSSFLRLWFLRRENISKRRHKSV